MPLRPRATRQETSLVACDEVNIAAPAMRETTRSVRYGTFVVVLRRPHFTSFTSFMRRTDDTYALTKLSFPSAPTAATPNT